MEVPNMNPLTNVRRELNKDDAFDIIDSEDNEDFVWIEVQVNAMSKVGMSEALATIMQTEGFKFIGFGEDENTARFNRQK